MGTLASTHAAALHGDTGGAATSPVHPVVAVGRVVGRGSPLLEGVKESRGLEPDLGRVTLPLCTSVSSSAKPPGSQSPREEDLLRLGPGAPAVLGTQRARAKGQRKVVDGGQQRGAGAARTLGLCPLTRGQRGKWEPWKEFEVPSGPQKDGPWEGSGGLG